MRKQEIGKVLKESRLNADKSIKEVSKLLSSLGIKASEKTIYGWESGHSQPNPDALLAMCEYYGVGDILGAFGYEADGSIFTVTEHDHIRKYRSLDVHGREVVNTVLDMEVKRTDQERAAEETRAKLDKARAHLRRTREDTETSTELISLPLYDISATAGLGNYIDDNPSYELVDVELADVPPGAEMLIRICGDSMEPEYSDGDIVFVESDFVLDSGEIGIFIVDGNAYCKELVRLSRNRAVLRSLNEKYSDMDLSKYDYCRTVGRIVGKYHSAQ